MAQKSIAELWARGVNEKTSQPKEEKPMNPAPIKPVKDDATESKKAQFRQNILNQNSKQKEQINE